MSREGWTLGRRPALDGIRGIAILLVVASHLNLPWLRAAGVTGVTLFFTLSGFLITALLLEEHARVGRVSLPAFYTRRARRLLPALVASIVVVAAASVVIGAWFFSWADGLAVAAYYGNWMMIDGDLGGLSGTWSLAVEEQFYLVWPVVMLMCLRRGAWLVGVVAAVGALAATVWRELLWADGTPAVRVYFGSETHADALLLGCLVAVVLHGSRVGRTWQPVGALALVAVLLVALSPNVFQAPMLFVPPLAAVMIHALCRGRGDVPWLSGPLLTWTGRRSYGLYLWHTPVSAYMTEAQPEWVWSTRLLVFVLVALPLTVLSWRYVEEPFLRRRPGVTGPSIKTRTCSSIGARESPDRRSRRAHVPASPRRGP